MRKLAFFSMMVALCMADFGAFAATVQRNTSVLAGAASTAGARTAARNVENVEEETVPEATQPGVAARAATKQATRPTAARVAATRPTTVKANAVTQQATVQRPTAARAATTKQKAINMGTKISGATENTVVSEECQDAYYGCMDAFCMMDNTSGGRCQCSDRHVELDAVLEDIMKLDEQSLAMATEGVERLQMGENAEEIMARAKAAADSVTGRNDTSKTGGASKVRTLDLSSFRNNNFFDDADDDVFQDIFTSMESSIADKTGDALQKEATRICTERIPQQCASSASFLQLTYAQRIKSDCTAYENSLKQQRSQSAEKLQTAQKALRDAALEMYQNENKYDFGQCVSQFKSCMQTTGECGDDYSGCVADTAILDELYGKGSGKSKNVATTVIKTGKTSITISSASFDILSTKKIMCESVTKQCVNANKRDSVWQQVLRDVAPVIYTAEYNAASNNRMNCISNIVNCVQTTCGSKWDEETDNYDACLSDPNSINNYCALEFKRCGDTDSEDNVRNYVMAKLAALKVDKCTKDVKACLLSDNRCGEDFAGCVGLDSDTIADLCPDDLLLSCQDRAKDGKSVKQYVAEIAQGIALNIDNKMATACQNAVDAAFERVCGISKEENGNAGYCNALDLNFSALDSGKMTTAFYDSQNNKLYDVLDQYVRANNLLFDVATSASNHISKMFNLTAVVRGQMNVDKIVFNGAVRLNEDEEGDVSGTKDLKFDVVKDSDPKSDSGVAGYDGFDGDIDALLAEMSRKYDSVIQQIESDATVYNCMHGRQFQAFSTARTGLDQKGNTVARFPNLTDEVKVAIANQVMSAVSSEYRKLYANLETTPAKRYQEILDFYMSKVEAKDAELDIVNEKICLSKRDKPNFGTGCGHLATDGVTVEYDKTTNKCTILKNYYHCRELKNWIGEWCRRCSMNNHNCDHYDGATGAWCRTSHEDKSIQMSYVNPDTGQVCTSDGSSNAVCPNQ